MTSDVCFGLIIARDISVDTTQTRQQGGKLIMLLLQDLFDFGILLEKQGKRKIIDSSSNGDKAIIFLAWRVIDTHGPKVSLFCEQALVPCCPHKEEKQKANELSLLSVLLLHVT